MVPYNNMPIKHIFNIKSHYQAAKSFYMRYERGLMPAMLLGGFLLDYIAFTAIQITFTLALVFAYWCTAGATIAFISIYDTGKITQKLKYLRLFSPLLLQFAFGALLSNSLIFYWFSGALSVSWPIVIIVALLMVFNDVFRHYFLQPAVQISVYFFATFSFLSIVLSFLIRSLSVWVFVSAGLLSLAVFLVFMYFAYRLKLPFYAQKRAILFSLAAIFCAMNGFYFFKIIPPIPLSLREAGLYHTLRSSGGSYTMGKEPESFWQRLIPSQVLHLAAGERVYCYTAIFAPHGLDTVITHRWQHYDANTKKWADKDKLSFHISGGRAKGYKGYSWNSQLEEGAWRIFVQNQRGQALGRIEFTVEYTQEPVALQEVIR